MKTIYKYVLKFDNSSIAKIEVPKESKILHCNLQDYIQNKLYNVWVEVETEIEEKEIRFIEICGTGCKLSKEAKIYINTILVQGGLFVFHFYEVKK